MVERKRKRKRRRECSSLAIGLHGVTSFSPYSCVRNSNFIFYGGLKFLLGLSQGLDVF